jgi:magnesium chelatase family protein
MRRKCLVSLNPSTRALRKTEPPRVYCRPFVLIGALNPCPCGWRGDPVHECTCSMSMVSRYQADARHPADLGAAAGPRRSSIGPHPRGRAPCRGRLCQSDEKLSDDRLGEQSPCLGYKTDAIRARVEAARARQRQRFEGTALLTDADMGPAEVRKYYPLDDAGRSLLHAVMQQLQMSARAYHGKTLCVFLSNSRGVARILKLARTIADPSTPQGRPGGE